MKTNRIRTIAKIKDVKFRNSSVYRNPSYYITFENETGEEIKKTVKARDIFDLLCRNNWDYAEPGILYWDRITNWNLVSNDKDFEYAGVNPLAI